MPLMHLIVLAVIQGVTEFLPISSSAHLILVPHLLHWSDQGQIIDVAMHVGTLGAVLLYFWRDTFGLITAVVLLPLGKRSFYSKLLSYLLIGSLPIFVAGYFINQYGGNSLRSVEVIAWMTIIFGIVLWICDRLGLTIRRLTHMDWLAALFIGVSQVLALVPGVSRSGITMSAARLLGFERQEAARFSMLLAIPTIIGAGVLKGIDLHGRGDLVLTQTALWAALAAFIAALAAIHVLMRLLARTTFTPFVLYRLALGLVLLAWLHKPLGWWVF